MNTEVVDIVLLGRNYKIACPEGKQRALLAAADEVKEKIEELRLKLRASSNEQLALMVALNICHQLHIEREELDGERQKQQQYSEVMDQRIKLLQQTIEIALSEQALHSLKNE